MGGNYVQKINKGWEMLDEAIKDILIRCASNTRFHAKFFFPEIFRAPFNRLHDEIIEVIDSSCDKNVVAAPRGIGKTSLMLYGKASRHILFESKKFIIYLSNSAENAVLQTDSLKHELLSNLKVRKFFGSIKTKRIEDEYEEQFSKKAWVTSGGTLVLPRGAGQQIRGLLYHGHRPDLIIIDDLEDKGEIMNEKIRKKNKEWFFSDVLKCISRYDKNFEFVYIDTLKHEDALLQDLLDAEDWNSICQSVCDADYNSLAPSFMTTEEIKKEVKEHEAKGLLDVFYREMMNIPVASVNATFKSEYFRYYEEGILQLTAHPTADGVAEECIQLDDLISFVIIDPAKEVQIHNADTAIVGVSIDRKTQKIFVRDIVSGKMYPDQIYKETFQMVHKLKAMIIAVEVTSLHQFISQPFQNAMRMENIYAQYHELKAIGKKEERISSMAPYYRQGQVFHNRMVCGKLEIQLSSFPRSKLMDVMDALGYTPKLMDDFKMYFDPIYEDPDSFDEYGDLTYEKPLSYQKLAA